MMMDLQKTNMIEGQFVNKQLNKMSYLWPIDDMAPPRNKTNQA